ncbi:MAG: RNA methyltransferase [Planctomycetota bacterium]
MISSRQNPIIKHLAVLLRENHARHEEGLAVAEGLHLVREAWKSSLSVRTLVHTPEMEGREEVGLLLREARGRGVECVAVARPCYERFSVLRSPEGIAAVLAWEEADPVLFFQPRCRLLALAEVQDPGNAGAMVRTAEAAGATGVLLCGGGVDLTHPALLRASMGSAFRLKTVSLGVEEFLSLCRKARVRVIVSVPRGGIPFDAAEYAPPVAIVIGGEGGGVPGPIRACAAASVSIPAAGAVESLNAAVAAGILLYRARKDWDLSTPT